MHWVKMTRLPSEGNLFVKLTAQLYSLCFVFVFCLPAIASAHTPNDPNYLRPDYSKNWKTLSTPHFRIHHEAAQQKFAQQMGAVAEKVHSNLTVWLGWKPEEPTEVVILDNVDYSNGAATVCPTTSFTYTCRHRSRVKSWIKTPGWNTCSRTNIFTSFTSIWHLVYPKPSAIF